MTEDKIETFMIYEERPDYSRLLGNYRHPVLVIKDTYENVEQFVKDLEFITPQPKYPGIIKRSFSTITTFESVADFYEKRNVLNKKYEERERMNKATEATYQGY